MLTGIAASENPESDSGKGLPSRLYVASGVLISGTGAPIRVHDLHATIQNGKSKAPDGCDPKRDPPQQVVTIQEGSAFVSNTALGILLNAKLAERGLEDIKVSNDKGNAKITGTDKKEMSIPFTVEGPVTLTPEGLIRLSTKKVDVAKLPWLADLMGVTPKKLTGDGAIKGIQAQKDAILFDPDLLWGLPVHGKVTKLAFQRNGLLLIFGNQATAKPSKTAPKASGKRAAVNRPH